MGLRRRHISLVTDSVTDFYHWQNDVTLITKEHCLIDPFSPSSPVLAFFFLVVFFFSLQHKGQIAVQLQSSENIILLQE